MRQRNLLVTQAILLGVAALLLWLALRTVSWGEIVSILREVNPRGLLLIALLDLGILFCITARWWLLLDGFGHRIPYWRAVRYRTTIFGLGYITPGPQVGGEVLQVYYPIQFHKVPLPVSLAAASVDKTLELVGSFTFIAIGSFAVLIGRHVISRVDVLAMGSLSLLLLVPLALIVQIWRGRHPFSGFVRWVEGILSHRRRAQLRQSPGFRNLPSLKRLELTLHHSEEIIASLHRTHPWKLVGVIVMTFLHWCFILTEFWTMTRVLGLPLQPGEAVGALVLVYFAALVPTPGGLGAVEAALVLAFTAFGYTAGQAMSLALLMRARDVTQMLIGLLLGGILFARRGSNARHLLADADALVASSVDSAAGQDAPGPNGLGEPLAHPAPAPPDGSLEIPALTESRHR